MFTEIKIQYKIFKILHAWNVGHKEELLMQDILNRELIIVDKNSTALKKLDGKKKPHTHRAGLKC